MVEQGSVSSNCFITWYTTDCLFAWFCNFVNVFSGSKTKLEELADEVDIDVSDDLSKVEEVRKCNVMYVKLCTCMFVYVDDYHSV